MVNEHSGKETESWRTIKAKVDKVAVAAKVVEADNKAAVRAVAVAVAVEALAVVAVKAAVVVAVAVKVEAAANLADANIWKQILAPQMRESTLKIQ
jgi:hypothetical protein